MATCGVEISKQCSIPLQASGSFTILPRKDTLGLYVILDGHLDAVLSPAIGVCRPERTMLWYRYHTRYPGSITIDCSRGRKDNFGNIVSSHGTQKRNAAVHVDIVVVE